MVFAYKATNKVLNARQTDVLNSAFVLLFGFSAKLNICASDPALRQVPNCYPQRNTNQRFSLFE